MSKMNLTEATMLALQGKLPMRESKATRKPRNIKKTEAIDVNVDDKTNVSVLDNETIVDTEEATIIVDKKQDSFIPETNDIIEPNPELPVDSVEVPIKGNETIIPEEIVDEPIVEPSEENAIDGDADLPEVDDEEKEESKKLEARERTTIDVYVVQGKYGQGWEDVYESEDRKDARDRLKEYDENEEEYSHRLITRRVKKESKATCEKCGKEVCECDKKVESKKLQEKLGYEPGICPDCGSDDLSYEKPISYTDSIEYPFHCNNCGADGTERYNLDFAESETNELEENKKVEKKSFKFENKKLQEEITDNVHKVAEEIAKEIEKVGCMNFQDIDEMAAEKLGLTLDKLREEQKDTDIYICLNYLGIDNNFGNGDFFTGEYAKEHPEVVEENVNIEISDDGKEIEVTTDDDEEVEVKDETPEEETIETDIEEVEPTENEEIEESKKLQENISAAPFRDLMYDCLRDDIEPADVMVERMLSAWSDDDCKWYCETYELVTAHNDFKDEEHYYEDIYGNIRDITGQVVDDDNLEETKHRKVRSAKALEERKNKSKNCDKECCVDIDEKTFNEALVKHLKVETVENAKITENNGKILLKAKVVNENKARGICFEMNKISENKNFVRYSLVEQKSMKTENKTNQPNITLLAYNKNNKLECRYIIKK